MARVAGWLRARVHVLRLEAVIAVQGGLAAGLSWFVAHDLLGHDRPFFAPISAVVVLAGAAGQRWRRALELVIGVALGIAVGDGLILVIGVGVAQIAAVVTLAILTAALLGGGNVVVAQAASSAVLVATLAPPSGGIYAGRFVDALVGGVSALAVMALVLPLRPLTRVRRSAGAAVQVLGDALVTAVAAMDEGDVDRARAALESLRAIAGEHAQLHAALAAGKETAMLSPLRWRDRSPLTRYAVAEVHIERAIRNARVLCHRVGVLIAMGEQAPPELGAALRVLADGVSTLRRELAQGVEPARTRQRLLAAIRTAGRAYEEGVGFSGSVVVAQIRSVAGDLLRATGLTEQEAAAQVRQAVAAPPAGAG